MSRTASNLILALFLAPMVNVAAAQDATGGSNIISSEIAISRERAEIKLELDNGSKVTLATVTGAPQGMQRGGVPGAETITMGVTRGDIVDRSWRDLLNRAMDADAASLGPLLRDWSAPSASATTFDDAIEGILNGVQAGPPLPAVLANGMNDSVSRLESRIQELQAQLEDARDNESDSRRHRGPDWFAPFRHIMHGITGILSLLVTYAVLFGLGVVTIMFGGRKYIEGVADTARAGMGRAFLVGLAGSFLLIPVFVLGIIALAISIVGIPVLLVWVPLFPIAALLAVLLGFLGVAHVTGENWAERHYTGSEWFTRANSYYFMGAGLTLLSALFFAANVITMAGPWLGFVNNILNFLGVVLTWAAATIGFGAVLLSRAGSRPEAAGPVDHV